MAIPNANQVFEKPAELMAYLAQLKFGLWRPGFITMHHTGSPDLAVWDAWQTRRSPITDKQWLGNLARYYGSAPPNGPKDGPWRAGPHFIFTPTHYCVLSPPNARGTHAVSFNARSWGVECVGDFDREDFQRVADRYLEGIAALHVAAGLIPSPVEIGVRGLHFHRDDPTTNKTCPGRHVDKKAVITVVEQKMRALTMGEHPSDATPPELTRETHRHPGIVSVDGLNVRASASAKSPVLRKLKKGTTVEVTGSAHNGETIWLRLDDGWVSAAFVAMENPDVVAH